MDDMDETIETHELQPFTGLGNDKVDNSRDDQDQVHDGIEKCPISWILSKITAPFLPLSSN